jgi:hypothetical protein
MPSTEAEILESVTIAIEGILPLPILEQHKRDIVSSLLWQITQARGKYRTRYRTSASMEPGTKLHHEHVFTRKDITTRILAAPQQAREILRDAIGCVVTVDEHRRLSTFDRTHQGWERYKAAGIEVIDTDALPPPGGEVDLAP